MTGKLIAEEGELKGLTLSFEEGTEWIVGRDPEQCQLVIDNPAVSRRHFISRLTDEGQTLENLSETNPVLVNGNPIEGAYLLIEGDSVSLGNVILRFTQEASTAPEGEESIEEVPSEPEEAVTPPEGKEEPLREEIAGETEEEKEPEHDTLFEAGEIEEEHAPEPSPAPTGAKISFDVMESGRWLMKVVGGPNTGAEFSLQTGTSYSIGTDPHTCDIIFHDTSVSRQHARLAVDDEEHLYVEDLGSRNGCYIDGERVEGRLQLSSNTLLTMGTTSFVVYDREGKMQTVISPLLPSIVKSLQRKEEEEEKEPVLTPEQEEQLQEALAIKSTQTIQSAVGAFILIGTITGLFVILGLGVTTLFQEEDIEKEQQLNANILIAEALTPFPDVQYSFNKNTGQLLLVGHVLRLVDKNQLIYNIKGLPFIRNVDDTGLVIDEFVWKEINQVLAKNPRWKGIIVRSPSAGNFVIEGYLKTKEQSEQLSDYLSANFPYLDLLEKRIVVEQSVLRSLELELKRSNIQKVKVQMSDGEVTFSGGVPSDKVDEFQLLMEDTEKIPGIRRVRNFTTKLAAAESVINVSDRYEVTGFSTLGDGRSSVIIDGRILMVGDSIDGMGITEIKKGKILLEKEGVVYRIDFK